MKTFGLLPEQKLETLEIDEKGNPVPPQGYTGKIVPFIKLPQPIYNKKTQELEPFLTWHGNRVEREWKIVDIDAVSERKHWTPLEFIEKLTTNEQVAIFTSADPLIVLFRSKAMAAQEIKSDDERLKPALDYMVAKGLLTAERVSEILES